MMKILFPHGDAPKNEIEEILRFAVEGRKRVKNQLMRIDSTYADVRFGYADNEGEETSVSAGEQDQDPVLAPD